MARARAVKKSPAKKAPKKPAKKKSFGAAPSGTNKERILKAIASRAALGEERSSRKTIMGMALITSEKSFANVIPDLKKRDGFVDYDAKWIWLTQTGRNHIGEDALAIPTDNGPMQDKIRSDMLKSKKAREIFDIMLDGHWYTRRELAEKMDQDYNKGFQNAVGSLSKIVGKDGDKIRLADICFPSGRPGEDA